MTKQCFSGTIKMELFEEFLLYNVDDSVYWGTLNWHKNVVEKPLCIFNTSKKEKRSFRYSKLNVLQIGKEVLIDQNSYKRSFKPVELSIERTSKKNWQLTMNNYRTSQNLSLISWQPLWLTS